MAEGRRFVLRPRWGTTILAVLFFAGCGAFLAHLAMNNDKGLVVNRLFHLDPDDASIVYGVLAALSAGFVVVGVLGALRLARGKHELVLTDDAITMPPSVWKSSPKTIRWDDVVELRHQTVSGQEFITIVHRGGQDSIARQYLDDWNTVTALIGERVSSRSRR